MWSEYEREIAEKVLRNLQSEKYKGKNYLFLQPFDLTQVPGYLDLIPEPLDLQTMSNRLQNGHYDSSSLFWQDLNKVFDNAVLYHNDKPTKWIAKMAKDMLKAVGKERKSLEQPKSENSGQSKPKINLLVKRPAPSSEALPDEQQSGPPPAKKAKISLKLKVASSPSIPGTAEPTEESAKAKTAQPKLRINLKSASAPASQPDPAPSSDNVLKSSTKTIKVSSKAGNSRGKELPKGVAEQQQKTKKDVPKDKNKKKTKKVTPGGGIAAKDKKQCSKILLGLRRRHTKTINWFLQPVQDRNILPDYKSKIKHPMDLTTLQNRLESGRHTKVADFVLDLRRIFANCLIFNTSIRDSLRPVACEVFESVEYLLKLFLGLPSEGSYPPVIFCWKLCVEILDTLYNLTNPTDGQPTVLYFLHPVSHYCGGTFPPDYLEKVGKPMDFGTITANLIEARYQSVDEFATDCRLVITNCNKYYSDREDGRIFVEQANRLNECLTRQLDQLARYVKSTKGTNDRQLEAMPVSTPKPPASLFIDVVQELRSINYTDKATKITEAAMGPFEKPVSLTVFPDYLNFVEEPMDLQSIEKKANADVYETLEDFDYDVNLMFRNCEVYNSQRAGDHLVAMAKFGLKKYRAIYYAKVRAFEDPSYGAAPAPNALNATSEKVDTVSRNIKISSAGASKGKMAPRISISAAPTAATAQEIVRNKSPKTLPVLPQRKAGSASTVPTKPNQPVPLHIAIARVKEAFPLRRSLNSLQSWEGDCARYIKELMKHPWISASRPKFIFHVPVPILFPDLRESYSTKIRKPMDLTTVECTLLAGNKYAAPEDFLQDVALVFSNAIRFNKDGRDIGDPLSCAYYDASVHLLRYSRWMSLELLQKYVDPNSELVDEPTADGLPPFSWKLTEGNRKRARQEMEELLMKEPIERSLEGDRYTWQEAECEKLLKALRHQSDVKQMGYFIKTFYPPDYKAFIAKPMDWDAVNRNLKKRHYTKFNDVIADLRLIFSNALRYNARWKGTDTDSGRAYESAVFMSRKLEMAINKMMLSVSDRLERERIDHSNAEREIAVAERAEEEKIRAGWKKEREEGSTQAPVTDKDSKIRLVRKATQRREAMDFEMPYFDEDENGQHEESYFEVIKLQKSIYEKQVQELTNMRATMRRVGGSVFARMAQREQALDWVAKLTTTKVPPAADDQVKGSQDSDEKESKLKESCVLEELEKEGRKPLKLQLLKPKAKKQSAAHHKRSGLDFE
ncbi:hypothetical protein FisN_10Hh077 [Fistulifera solaris]|uniref:Bromo domain-containing protein n=1 Tax=Fistulifera solaris TaxID=1519565 RepID=A0A1Z5JXR9_FISSO|nr:hypothetical protein FisN_10Hh077 [Fistulifera solaris]|eukprot:GAX18709.1 hypothetical protein FisN_10Hh077 [Fistulifera solaris]